MDDEKYLVFEWWQNFLTGIFPERPGSPDPSWHLRKGEPIWAGFNAWNFQWYKSDVVVLGYMHKEKVMPFFWIYAIEDPDSSMIRDFNRKDSERELQILEALAKPELLPLCMNTWAGPFMINYFRRIQQQTS